MFSSKCLIVPLLLLVTTLFSTCSRKSNHFVVAIESNIITLDPLVGTDSASERMRQLMFNSLVRKNEKYEYVGELASKIETSPDYQTITFTLHNNVLFHNGSKLTSADVKYTLDTLLHKDFKSLKASPFFEGKGKDNPYVTSVEAPDEHTIVIKLRKPWLELLGNLVSIGIIPKDSAATQATSPVGTGPFKYVSRNESQLYIDMARHEQYWQGTPAIKELRGRVILDANTLQAEIKSRRIDLVPYVTSLSPDAFKALSYDPRLKVENFPGGNVFYLGFNTQSEPLNNSKVRQAIAYAINRELIIDKLLLNQARIAHSMIPPESWAYHPGQTYTYSPETAKKLLDEAGFRDSGNGIRFSKPIVLSVSASSNAIRQYANVIQNSLKDVGIPVEVESLEFSTLLDRLRKGQYQMNIGQWVGGNQDPVFLKELYTTGTIFNRSRFTTPELTRILPEAVATVDREKAKQLYVQAQDIISHEMPTLPLWYPNLTVVARKEVTNIQVDPSNDWNFIRKVTIAK
jgi:peptide/nickel transport system substrate-binding protein